MTPELIGRALRPADRCAPNDNPLPSSGVRSDSEPATRAGRVLDDVEVDLAIRGAACFADCPKAVEHRGGDHEVRDEQLRTLGNSGRASFAARGTVDRGRDLGMDLDEGAVEADAVAPADELDVAVDLVVAAADERRLGKAADLAIDERSRSMVVDREQDDVAFSNDLVDVAFVEVERDRLAGETCFADPAGEGLGLVSDRRPMPGTPGEARCRARRRRRRRARAGLRGSYALDTEPVAPAAVSRCRHNRQGQTD